MDKDERWDKQLDKLWDKVQKNVDRSEATGGSLTPSQDFASAFELAQVELQAESLNLLKARFEKEKIYWENLVSSKDALLHQMKSEVEKEREKAEQLKNRVLQLQNAQAQLVQESFNTMELQKRALTNRMNQYEKDLEETRQELIILKLSLKDEQEANQNLQKEWQEKENKWIEERNKREADIQQVKQDLYLKRQSELEEISKLEQSIRTLQKQSNDKKNLYETEKHGFENLLNEKEGQIAKFNQELDQLRQQSDKEKDERRLAAVERERQTVQAEENKKRVTEQILQREMKIKEIQESLERLIQERATREESLKKREEEVFLQEEALRRRREEWVESIKSQSNQQLSISDRVVQLLNKVELRQRMAGPQPVGPAVSTPPPLPVTPKKETAPEKIQFFGKIIDFLKREKGKVLLAAGILLTLAALFVLFYDNEGRKLSKAQRYLEEGNNYYVKGKIDKAANALELAYKLDPDNSIVKNSLALVAGELAHKDYREGRLEEALKRTELLYKMIPDDPDIIALHTTILQALGRDEEAKEELKIPEPKKQETLPVKILKTNSDSLLIEPSKTENQTQSMQELIPENQDPGQGKGTGD